MLIHEILPPEILALLQDGRYAELNDEALDWPDVSVAGPALAEFLWDIEDPQKLALFESLPEGVASSVFSHLDSELRDQMLDLFPEVLVAHLLENMSPDDRTGLLEDLPEKVAKRYIGLLSPEEKQETYELLGYPEESVGRLMTPDFSAVHPEWTVAFALQHIRETGQESETVDVVYVLDEDEKLIDAISIRRFIFADPFETVESLMDQTFVSLTVLDDREDAVRLIQKYDKVALPVVDADGVMVGIVTIDDLLDVAEEEFTEDFQKFAALQPMKMGYWQASNYVLVKSRVGWLAGLVMVSLVSSGVIGYYEDVLAEAIALAFFIPLVIGTGGNAGTQSATMMIRSISTGEVDMGEWLRAFGRELFIGFALGILLGILGFVLGVFRGGAMIGLVVFSTMAVMLTITNLMGCSLPFILTRIGLDPASASGPLVASIADAIGLLVYFWIASLVFSF